MIRFILALLLCLSATPALAQNPQCPDRPASSNDNSCANTRWVKANGGGGGGSVGTDQYLGNIGAGTTGLTIPNCPTGALQYTDGVGLACGSAAGLPSIANGHLIANDTGGTHLAQDTAPSSWFDQAYCATIGNMVLRITGSWVCNKTVYAEPRYFDSACVNNTVGIHDCTAAITSCISSGSVCLIRTGYNLEVSSCITMSAQNQAIVGQGGGSVITQITPNSCTLEFTIIGIQISNLSIVYQTQGTSGGFAIFENNPQNAGGNRPLTIINGLFIQAAYVGINTQGGLENSYRDIFILNATLAGVYCYNSGFYLMKDVSAAGMMSEAALYIYGNSGGIIEGGEWEAATGYGLEIVPDGGGLAWNFSRITNVFIDNPQKGSIIQGAYNNVFNDTYFSTSVVSGPVPASCLVVTGLVHTTFSGNQFANCGENGLITTSSSYLVVSGNHFLGNSLLTPATYAGLNISTGTTEVEVLGNISTGPDQVYGVYIDPGASNGSVMYNLVAGNAVGGIHCGSASFTCQAANH